MKLFRKLPKRRKKRRRIKVRKKKGWNWKKIFNFALCVLMIGFVLSMKGKTKPAQVKQLNKAFQVGVTAAGFNYVHKQNEKMFGPPRP